MPIKPVGFAPSCDFLNLGICRARFKHLHKISNAAVAHRERPRRPESSKNIEKGVFFVNPGEGQVTVYVTVTRKHKHLNG